MVRDVQGQNDHVFSSKRLGLSEEIPRVVLDSPETDRGLFVCDFMC